MKSQDIVIGSYVIYVPTGEIGRIKSLCSDEYVFVVYKCNNDWENFKEYTAARTSVNDLENQGVNYP